MKEPKKVASKNVFLIKTNGNFGTKKEKKPKKAGLNDTKGTRKKHQLGI